MPEARIAVTLEDRLVAKLDRLERRRLAEECARLDRHEEQRMADAGLDTDAAAGPAY